MGQLFTAQSFRVLLSSICLLGAGSAMAADASRSDHTLAGIYELAVANDHSIAQARAQLRADREQRNLGRAGLLPQVNANYSTSESDRTSGGEFLAGGQRFPNNTETVTETDEWSVSLSQPLFDMSAWFELQRGQALSEQATARFELAQQDLLVRTIDRYIAVIRAASNLEASRSQERALESQLEQVNQRYDVGMVPVTDVQEAQAAYDQAVAQRISDESSLEVAREQLSVLTGRPHAGPLWRLQEEFPVNTPEPADPGQWVEFAQRGNLDIEVAEYGVQVARNQQRSAASNHLPTVDFSYSVSSSESISDQTNLIAGTSAVSPSNSDSDNWSITVSMPLYSGGSVSAQRRQASANLSAQQSGMQGTIRQVTQQTRAAFLRTRSNVNRVSANERALESARTALSAAEAGYEAGTRNIVDVVNAQQQLSAAERDYDNAILDYVLGMIELKRLAGTLSPADIYELNDRLSRPEPSDNE